MKEGANKSKHGCGDPDYQSPQWHYSEQPTKTTTKFEVISLNNYKEVWTLLISTQIVKWDVLASKKN